MFRCLKFISSLSFIASTLLMTFYSFFFIRLDGKDAVFSISLITLIGYQQFQYFICWNNLHKRWPPRNHDSVDNERIKQIEIASRFMGQRSKVSRIIVRHLLTGNYIPLKKWKAKEILSHNRSHFYHQIKYWHFWTSLVCLNKEFICPIVKHDCGSLIVYGRFSCFIE